MFVDETGAAVEAIVLDVDKKTQACDLEMFPRGVQSYAKRAVAFDAAGALRRTWHFKE